MGVAPSDTGVTVVRIVPRDAQQAAVWRLARDVSELLAGLPWVLVGGLMVQVHEAEAGRVSAFATGDVDAVLDVRALSTAKRQGASRLVAAGFEPVPEDERLVYRFRRGSDIVDLLAPDRLGTRADITTVPPGRTLEAIGARQAINRSRGLTVDAGDDPFELPVPSLIGAIVFKARVVLSVGLAASREKHERDVARLLALVADPMAAREVLTTKEHGYLRALASLTDPSHRAWRGVAGARDAGTALRILSDTEG